MFCILATMSGNFVFANMGEKEMDVLTDAMERRVVNKDDLLIKQVRLRAEGGRPALYHLPCPPPPTLPTTTTTTPPPLCPPLLTTTRARRATSSILSRTAHSSSSSTTSRSARRGAEARSESWRCCTARGARQPSNARRRLWCGRSTATRSASPWPRRSSARARRRLHGSRTCRS